MNLEELLQEARDGNMVAQFDLAEQYGKRLKDATAEEEIREYSQQAVYWLKESARQGYGPAVDAMRELNIHINDTEKLLNNTAKAEAPAAADEDADVKRVKPQDTRVMPPLGSRDKTDQKRLQEEQDRADGIARTNKILAVLLAVSILINAFLLFYLFRLTRQKSPAPDPKGPASVSEQTPAPASEKPAESSAKPGTTPAESSAKPSPTPQQSEATPSPSPSAAPSPSPTPTTAPTATPAPRSSWLDLSSHNELKVLPEDSEVYDDYVYYAVTASSGLNMRAGPDTSYDRIGSVPNATKVGAVAKRGNWYLVYYDGKYGWVSSSYLTTNLNYATANSNSSSGDLTTW